MIDLIRSFNSANIAISLLFIVLSVSFKILDNRESPGNLDAILGSIICRDLMSHNHKQGPQ